MSRRKLAKFEENRLRDNVIEPGKPLYDTIKGKWNTSYFQNNHPITLELACGRGEYSIGMARKFPSGNFIGVDLKGDRIWKGSGIAIEEGLENVAFLRTQIQWLEKYFAPGEVGDIWITFPDPRPKDRDEKHRLTNNSYLDLYKSILAEDGWINFKTDNSDLFQYTLDVLEGRKDIRDLTFEWDVYGSDLEPYCHGIQTKYESIFHTEANKIKYLRFRFMI